MGGDSSRVIAGTDCGFSTVAGYTMVAEDVVWAKLRTLAEGARIVTRRLKARGRARAGPGKAPARRGRTAKSTAPATPRGPRRRARSR
jgi:hypothetical protein